MSGSYYRNPEILTSEMDGDFVMMNSGTGEYHSIRGSGAVVWELVGTPVTEAQLVTAICAQYDVDEDVCRADVRRFLDELLAAGLVLSG